VARAPRRHGHYPPEGTFMQIAVDISLYPLTGDYIPPIKGFIERLGRRPGLAIEYNSMSTQVRGDFDAVFDALRAEVRTTFAGPDRAVLVLKVLGGPVPGATVA
jgi:uncharacterized protein YqgV (UPF0045/DUF77 family)